MRFPSETVPLFVYGSLRPGMTLWSALQDDVLVSRPAAVRGRLHWHTSMEWPVLTTGSADDGWVTGELLDLRPGDAVNRVIVDEEVLYGYDARWMPVRLGRQGDGDGEREAIVLVWNRDTDLGPAIPGGDYAHALAERDGGS